MTFDKNIMLKWRKWAIDQENHENKKNNKIGIIALKNMHDKIYPVDLELDNEPWHAWHQDE